MVDIIKAPKVSVQDEGVLVGRYRVLNFVGDGVTVTDDGHRVTITIGAVTPGPTIYDGGFASSIGSSEIDGGVASSTHATEIDGGTA
jgi:hypothetical protein